MSAVRPNTVVVRDCIGHSFFCAEREPRCDCRLPRITVTLSLRRPRATIADRWPRPPGGPLGIGDGQGAAARCVAAPVILRTPPPRLGCAVVALGARGAAARTRQPASAASASPCARAPPSSSSLQARTLCSCAPRSCAFRATSTVTSRSGLRRRTRSPTRTRREWRRGLARRPACARRCLASHRFSARPPRPCSRGGSWTYRAPSKVFWKILRGAWARKARRAARSRVRPPPNLALTPAAPLHPTHPQACCRTRSSAAPRRWTA